MGQKILKKYTNLKRLLFYQKADALYQITFDFCERFLPAYGDRTVDQMVQAARSGKQNIVEGTADGITSSEMEIKLINVARGSLRELQEDYEDYLKTRQLTLWTKTHPRFEAMLHFCREHHDFSEYQPHLQRFTDEEICNLALTLCHITDKMMYSYLDRLEKQFVEQGGIKERMHAARTGYRQEQDRNYQALIAENEQLRTENSALRAENERLKKELSKSL